MKTTTRRIVLFGIIAAIVGGLSACPNPMLAAVKQEVARSRVLATTYSFLQQWGNPNPIYTFNTTLTVSVDTAGYVYATDRSFRINKYNSSGALVLTIPVAGAGFVVEISDMAFDTSGNMYVTTTANQVQKYSVSGSLVLQFGSYGTGNGQLSSPQGIAIDNSGNIYVVDGGNNRVQKFDSSGSYLDQWTGTGKNGTGTAFSYPHGAVVSGSDIYVVDTDNSTVKEYDLSGNYVASFGSYGTGTSSGSTLYFSYPQGIAKDGSGNFYVADTNNARVQEFTPGFSYSSSLTGGPGFTSVNSVGADSNGNVYTSDGSGNDGRIQKFTSGSWVATWGGDDRTVAGALSMPTGVMYGPSGVSYVIDNLNNRIQEFDANGAYVRSWGSVGPGTGQFAFSSYPLSGACDSAGNVYVPDFGNNRVQRFDANGGSATIFVSSGPGDGFVEGPSAVAVDSAGNLYVLDLTDSRIQVFNSSGYFVRKWAAPGTGGLGIAVDPSGNVWVTDYVANTLTEFNSSGTQLNQWGGLGAGSGQFDVPVGVAADSSGYVYVSDMLNRRIQKFDSSGNLVMQFGSVGMGSGGFGWPVGIAINAAGQILVSDYMGCLVQEFNPNAPKY